MGESEWSVVEWEDATGGRADRMGANRTLHSSVQDSWLKRSSAPRGGSIRTDVAFAVAVSAAAILAASLWFALAGGRPSHIERDPEARAAGSVASDASLVRTAREQRRAVVDDGPAAVPPATRFDLEARLVDLARAEEDLARSRDVDGARQRLEEAVAELCDAADALECIGAVRERVGAAHERTDTVREPAARSDEAEQRYLRYGSVRAFYWVAQQRTRTGQDAVVRAAVLEAIDHVAALDAPTAAFLCDCLVALIEARAVDLPVGVVERLIERRLRVPERAGYFDRLLMAVAQGLDEDTRLALSAWLVRDPSDTDAVVASLSGFFEVGRDALALEVARDAFETADPPARTSLAEAVARRAPTDAAAAFLVERADQLQAAFGAWSELGTREGGVEALTVAYDGLRVLEENANGRRLAVMAMGEARAEDLRWIAGDDPDPHVRGQALLTLSTRGGPIASADLDLATGLLADLDGPAFGSAAAGARNLLRRAERAGRTDERVRLVEALRAVVLDDGRSERARRDALGSLEGWIDDAQRQWLDAEVAGR